MPVVSSRGIEDFGWLKSSHHRTCAASVPPSSSGPGFEKASSWQWFCFLAYDPWTVYKGWSFIRNFRPAEQYLNIKCHFLELQVCSWLTQDSGITNHYSNCHAISLRCSFMGLLFTEAIWKAAFWRMVPYWEQKNLANISLIGILEFLWPPGTCRVRRYVHRSLDRSFGSGKVTPSLLQGLVGWGFFCSWLFLVNLISSSLSNDKALSYVHLSEGVIVTGFCGCQLWAC